MKLADPTLLRSQCYVNGQWLNQTTECTISNGFVGFQSEGGDMEIRRVTLVPLAGAAK